MKDRDLHGLLQLFFDIEALGGLDVLQVDAAEGRLQQLAGLDDLIRVLRIQLDIEDIDVGETFEQNPFPFHDRLAGQGAQVPQSQNRCAVGNHRHQVPLGGIFISIFGIFLDRQTGLGYPGRIGQ